MPPTLRAGIILGLSVVAWTFITGFTGWYKDPQLNLLFLMVIPIQIAILVWALRGTAADSGFGRQIWNGVSISLLASMIIYGGSILFTTVVFPNYFQELEAIGRDLMAKKGLSQAQIDAAILAQAQMQTPRAQAMAGTIGTVVTGFFTSLIAAIWLRKK